MIKNKQETNMYKKIIGWVVAFTVGVLGGYVLISEPEPIIEIEEVEVEVEVKGDTVYVPYKVEVVKEVPVAGAASELIALRENVVDGWVDELEKRIEWVEENRMESIEKDIKDVENKRDFNKSLISLLEDDDIIGNAIRIKNLRADNIILEDELEVLKDELKPFTERVELDEKAIAEINAYVLNGTDIRIAFSNDVEDRLEFLLLLN